MSEDTKQRIIRATLQTLREHGAAGTSARAIAAAGDFNTSLLFYHFGSVEGALLAAAHHDTDARIARYSAHLEGLTDLSGLVRFSRQMHRENLEAGHVTALVQMLALTSTNPEIREELASVFDPWIDMVETTLDRLVGKDGIAGLSNADLAVGITSLFLGLELLTHLGDRYGRAEGLLDALDDASGLLVAFGLLSGAGTTDTEEAAGQGLRPHRDADPLADLPGPTNP